MNSILSKSLKILIAFMLCLCICFSLTACTKNTKNIKNVDQICISGALYESWMYVVTDEDFINEMVEIYNSVSFEKTDTAVDMMTADEVCVLSFNKGSENVAKFIVDKSNNFSFEAGGQSYHIVSDFDFKHIKSLVDEQREEVKVDTNTETEE